MPSLTRHDRRLAIAEPPVVEVQDVLVGVQPLPDDGLHSPTRVDLNYLDPANSSDHNRGAANRFADILT